MYRCNNCGQVFKYRRYVTTTLERIHGVSSDFANGSVIELEICPRCGENDIEEIEDKDGSR